MFRAVADSVALVARAAAVPWVISARWIDPWRVTQREIPSPGASLSLAAKVAADEVFLASEILSGSFIGSREPGRIHSEIASALEFYERCGWLDDPASYHLSPGRDVFRQAKLKRARLGGTAYWHLQADSNFEPHPGEPGRERWLDYRSNRTAHAWILRHGGDPRPWVVCVPGYRMGHPRVDFTGFRALWLHEKLGLNVAIPVLPFHGPRREGLRGGDGFLAGDLLDTIHSQAQAVQDVRSVVEWTRNQGAPSVALYGLSLGAYTAGLVAALDRNLDCVIAGIPASCWIQVVRFHAPRPVLAATELMGFPWEAVEKVMSVVSPLAMEARVPKERRFLFAATADRLAPPEQAYALWRHWEKPEMAWYHGSHVSFFLEEKVQHFVAHALTKSAVRILARKPRRTRKRSQPPRDRSRSARL